MAFFDNILSEEGFRKKLIFKFVVTASAITPISANMATYKAASDISISTGPDTVLPGRR